ncbi:MAG: hypothetical protein PWR06_127 [Thermoanaerobacteraceae bacterium]|nr:hypothetical protein [Thermoanaerobacteraceae bacterium]
MKLLTDNFKYINADLLRQYCKELFVASGMPEDEAYINADNLVEANLTGVDSHGVSRMAIYLKRIREGVVNPVCRLKTVQDYKATAAYDACNSMGAVASYKVMKIAIEKARQYGVAFITVKNSNHFGTAAYFAKMAINEGMIGIASTNGPARMAPWGGRDPYFGTNPFAVAVPAGKEFPVIADMATSVVARGKIILAAKNNKEIPDYWALDKNGEKTTNAQAALEGTVLPFGGPKGSAIALLIDVMAGVLAGAAFGRYVKDMYADFENPTGTGHFFGAINIESFVPLQEFKNNMDKMIRDVKKNTPAKGVEEIFLPGEIELRKREKRLKEGIPITIPVLNELKIEGERYGVPFNLS